MGRLIQAPDLGKHGTTQWMKVRLYQADDGVAFEPAIDLLPGTVIRSVTREVRTAFDSSNPDLIVGVVGDPDGFCIAANTDPTQAAGTWTSATGGALGAPYRIPTTTDYDRLSFTYDDTGADGTVGSIDIHVELELANERGAI